MSPDRLPIVGAVPYAPDAPERPRRFRHPPVCPGLWCAQGFGSRGIVWSALMADFLVSRMAGAPLPLPYDLARALAPERFLPSNAAS
jgi:tRNA 5-methylaminomethyl-2-thiouridine biosynthesis bifunctional protein